MATVDEATIRLRELQQAVGKFHAARAKTRDLLEGRRKLRGGVTRAQAADIIAAHRRAQTAQETEAATGLRNLLRAVYQREPEPAEVLSGVSDEALGLLPALPLLPLAIVAGGAITLTSLFSWLTAREETAQRAAGMTHSWSEVIGQAAPVWGPILATAAVAGGAYWLWTSSAGKGKKGGKPRAESSFPKLPPKLEKNPAPVDEDDDEAEDEEDDDDEA